MKQRILSTATLWAILIVALTCFGTRGCLALIVMASMLTQYEFYKLLQLAGHKPAMAIGLLCGIAMQAQYGLPQCFFKANPSEALVVVVIIIIAYMFARRSIKVVRESLLPTLLGVAYVPFMLTFPLAFVGDMQASRDVLPVTSLHTLLWLVAIIKFSDVGGMLFGCAFGKHKLAPDFSPNKTVEGLIGGIIASITVGLITFFIFRNFLIPSITLRHTILLSGFLSLVAVLGDLVESIIKRIAEVKDSGNIVPGIGGMFDLTDSLILALPMGVLYLKYISM
ncbi:MAG: phosphatidate cytidylyltransferase [Puniceicoccales bacterium]|jgi:phosphatidate cytidylyltransferase|nr:phosphatidate cytidylyltransferase [Puniceicoccales bacterium]